MIYSRNINRRAFRNRIIASWCIVASVGFLIGGALGYALKTHITAKDNAKEEMHTSEQVQSEMLVYGAYDDRIFTEEISLDWGSGDIDFKALDCAMPDEEQEFLYYLCEGYNIDFTLVMAMIEHESSFQADVISTTNDYGLMQINKMNHEWLTETLGVTDYLDPYENIMAGVFVLRKLFEKYQDSVMVLMAYHMGEGGAKRLWDKGIYETNYTQSILRQQAEYNKQSGSE